MPGVLGAEYFDTVSADGMFSWTEVECLGACVNAPMAQINKYYYEDLTPENFESILQRLRKGEHVEPGPQNGRQACAPASGPNTLTDAAIYGTDKSAAEPGYAGPAIKDAKAKRPGAAANVREAAVPKPPLDDSTKKGPR